MKLLTLTILLFLSVSSWGQEEPEVLLQCEIRNIDTAAISIHYNQAMSGSLHHDYTSANIACPVDTNIRINNSKAFKCAGVWNFDFIQDGKRAKEVQTIAEVDFKPNTLGEWYAVFTTTHTHGRRELRMPCTVISQDN